jgi:hypothetical protein
MIDPALLAEVKIISIGPAGGKRNHPIYRRSPPGVLRPLFCCCVFQIPCLFNYPRQLAASAGHKRRGAIVGTVSFSEAVSHDVRMVRRTLRPAHTGWLENLAIVEITPNPKGNLSHDAQHPNRCDDLSHHYWTDCRRMISNRQRSDGQRQQALHRTRFQLLFGWEEAERAAPETETPPSSPRPNASRCSKSPEPSVGSVCIAPGARNHAQSKRSCTDRCRREADRSDLCTCPHTAALALPGGVGRWFIRETNGYRRCTRFHAAKRAFGTLALSGKAARPTNARGLQGGTGRRSGRTVTSTVDIEDAYIARVMAAFKKVTPHTRGNQFGRTTRAARKQAIIRLIKRGYSVKAATQIIDDAHDVFLVEASAMRGAS